MRIIKKNISFIGLIAFVVLIYILTLRGLVGNLYPTGVGKNVIISNVPPFESSQERGRYALTISLVENHSFAIDRFKDFIMPDLAWHSGHYYSAFPPGPSIMAVPLYLVGKFLNLSQLFTFSISTIFSILTMIVIIFIGKRIRLSKKAIMISVLTYSLASVAWAYSVTLSAHPISAFFITLAFFIFLKINPKNARESFLYLLLLWVVYAINLFIDYPNLVIIFPIIVSCLIKIIYFKNDENKIQLKIPLTILYSLVSLIFILVTFVAFNNNVYGMPLVFTNTFNLKVLENKGIDVSPKNLSNDLFKKINYSTRFTLGQLGKGVKILSIDSDRGILFYSPIFIFSILGFIIALRRKKYWVILAFLTFLVDLILYASFDDPWGGWAFGPRYLIPTIPMLVIILGYSFDNFIKKKWFRKLIASLFFIYGVGVSLVGALTTNAVPPSVEAIPLKMSDNYILNWNYLMNGQSSSFVYNFSVIHKYFAPSIYFFILFLTISFFGLIIIWKNSKKL